MLGGTKRPAGRAGGAGGTGSAGGGAAAAGSRDLLASVLDGAETDGGELTRVLDSIPGAWERAELGRAQGTTGETTPLDQL